MDKHQVLGHKRHKLSLKRRNPPKLKKDQVPEEKGPTLPNNNNEHHREVVSDENKGECTMNVENEDSISNNKKIKMEEGDDDNDFKSKTIDIRKLRKNKGQGNEEALVLIENEQLQLAMALSSSEVAPLAGHTHNTKPKLRLKKGEVRAPPTLLTSSSSIKTEIIVTRLEEMLTCEETPAGVVGVAKNDVSVTNNSNDSQPLVTNNSNDSQPLVTNNSNDSSDDFTVVPTTDQLSLHCPDDGRFQECDEFSSYKTLWVLSASGPEEPPSVLNVPGLKHLMEGAQKVDESKCCVCHSDPCLATLVPNSPAPNLLVPNSIGMKPEVDVPLLRDYDNSSPTKRLKTDLNDLLTSSAYSDVKIKVSNDKIIHGHSSILSVRSPAMARVLSSLSPDSLTIDCSSFSFESVNILMRFIYTATVPNGFISDEIKQELLTLSEIWEVPDLFKLLIATPTSPLSTTPTLSPEHIPSIPSSLEGEMGCSSSLSTSSDEEEECMSPHLLDIQSQDTTFPINAPSIIDTPTGCGHGAELVTPANNRRSVFQSDDNITPMPDYRTMATPHLKSACSKFGVRVLPKKKMIKVLEQIYTYNHPLVDESGYIIDESQSTGSNNNKIEIDHKSVREAIVSDTEMYQDILKYKPLELSLIHSKLKNKQINISREKLMDILDQMCVTYTIPRQRTKKMNN